MDEKELAARAQAKIDAREAAKKASADSNAERARLDAERKVRIAQRTEAFWSDTQKKCQAIPQVTCRREADCFMLKFENATVKLALFDLAHQELDLGGYANIQRWQRNFAWTTSGDFVLVRFLWKSGAGPASRVQERWGSSAEEFRTALFTGGLECQRTPASHGQLLDEAIEYLINLA